MPRKVIDLFAGVGGLSLGFKQVGFEVVVANEYDSEIAAAYKHNNPTTKMIVADIRTLVAEKFFHTYKDKVDVVVGGPPCQGYSQKGQRRTINDDRNFLFQSFVEVVKVTVPPYFVMENVPTLLTAEDGFFRRELEVLFNGLGYQLSLNVLNASDFGVPQLRRRAIIVGSRGRPPRDLRSLAGVSNNTVWDAISDLAYLQSGEGHTPSQYRLPAISSLQRQLRGSNEQLHNHIATKHSALALERLKLIPPNCTKKVLPAEHQTKSIYSGTWTRLDGDGFAPTITTRFDTPSSGQFTHPTLDRAITVREAARLQTFPDTYVFTGTKTSQMRQVGNAVPPFLAKAIARHIADIMNSEE